MIYIGKNQSTEEIMVEDKDGTSCNYVAVEIQDAGDREESAERVNWNQDRYQPEKKTKETIFII